MIVSLMDYSWILNFYWIIYGLNLGMLLLVVILGHTSGGATRWLSIGGSDEAEAFSFSLWKFPRSCWCFFSPCF